MSVFDNDLPTKCNPDKKGKKRKKKSHIVSLIQDTWKSNNSIKIKWNFSKLPLKMCRLVGCLREAVEHGGWTVNVITFFAILVASFVKNIIT